MQRVAIERMEALLLQSKYKRNKSRVKGPTLGLEQTTTTDDYPVSLKADFIRVKLTFRSTLLVVY